MRKLWVVFSVLISGLMVSALWLSQGCSGKIPTMANIVATSTPTLPPDYISDFENGGNKVNPYLTNAANGYWTDSTYGGPATALNVINDPFIVPNTVADSVDSSNYAAHMFARLIAFQAWQI